MERCRNRLASGLTAYAQFTHSWRSVIWVWTTADWTVKWNREGVEWPLLYNARCMPLHIDGKCIRCNSNVRNLEAIANVLRVATCTVSSGAFSLGDLCNLYLLQRVRIGDFSFSPMTNGKCPKPQKLQCTESLTWNETKMKLWTIRIRCQKFFSGRAKVKI